MIMFRPFKEEIEFYLHFNDITLGIDIPLNNKEEWNKNHTQFVLRVLIPLINPPIHVKKIVTEAYLTNFFLEETKELKSFEQILSDGSSVVPDCAYRWGHIKDVWGVAHDYVYRLHKWKMKDIYNHEWSLIETHNMYRDGWLAQKNPIIGYTWWSGLMIGGWIAWNKKFNNKPEKITKIIYGSNHDYSSFI